MESRWLYRAALAATSWAAVRSLGPFLVSRSSQPLNSVWVASMRLSTCEALMLASGLWNHSWHSCVRNRCRRSSGRRCLVLLPRIGEPGVDGRLGPNLVKDCVVMPSLTARFGCLQAGCSRIRSWTT